MKRIPLLIFICACSIILTGCSNLISKGDSRPAPGASIIYGKFSGLPTPGYFSYFNLYNREKGQNIEFDLKTNFDDRDTIYFAYSVSPGRYELFSFTEGYTLGSGSYRTIYYWIKSDSRKNEEIISNRQAEKAKDKLSKVKDLFGLSQLDDTTAKTFDHDEIEIPSNQIVYTGDWQKGKLRPVIIDNKKETDIEIKKGFPKLMVEEAVTIIPSFTN